MLTASVRSLAAPLLLQFRPIGRELRPGHIPRSPDPTQIDRRRTGDTAIQGAPLRPKPPASAPRPALYLHHPPKLQKNQPQANLRNGQPRLRRHHTSVRLQLGPVVLDAVG